MTTITVSTALSTFDQLESAARSYCRGFRHVLTSAAGSIVRDSTGREYIDFLANAGALNYGHNDPDLKAALIDYLLEDGITASLDLHTNVKA
ncbi:MAG: diaminobutyrate--2-oxoglutarate transaminase, partial [Propionicimonas sp.]